MATERDKYLLNPCWLTDLMQHVGLGEAECCERRRRARIKKAPPGLLVWRKSDSLIAGLPAYNELSFRPVGIAHSSPFIAFGCPRLSLQDVGEATWAVLMKLFCITVGSLG